MRGNRAARDGGSFEIVNSWGVDAVRARLLANGNLLVIHGSISGEKTLQRTLTLREHLRKQKVLMIGQKVTLFHSSVGLIIP